MTPDDAFIDDAGKDLPERGQREKQLEELFATFDSATVPADIREEAFHRENWYR